MFIRSIIGVLSFLLLLSGQAMAETPVYNFAIPPWQKGRAVDDIRILYKPMLTWLGEQTGSRFNFIQGRSYAHIIEMVANGQVQLAGMSPVPYVLAKRMNPEVSVLTTELKWNKDKTRLIDAYRGYILTHQDREDIQQVEDLAGKRFGFVKLESSSGYKYPNALLRDRGIIPAQFFSDIFFLGGHPRVTDAIAAGSIDAGATWDFNWSQAEKKHGQIFKPILETPPIPNLCIVAHPSLPKSIQDKIQGLLVNIDPALLKGLPAQGYAVRPDSFYDIVRTLVDQEEGEK
ncbi:MAG: phosphate/phosphite/phosphonate ABC transporter substrate-binding protein [Magnetococcales bacterium]|nr:phosphate/phosphite/phosphonate ABC transporter substrate-binding protein [Magnetococcales bacterium]